MQFDEYLQLVRQIKTGKQLPDAVYLHNSALDVLPRALLELLNQIIRIHGLEMESWEIVKFFKRDFKLSLLSYPDFFDESYPALRVSCSIDLERGSVTSNFKSLGDGVVKKYCQLTGSFDRIKPA